MIDSRRCVRHPRLGVLYETRSIVYPHFRFYVEALENAHLDSSLFASSFPWRPRKRSLIFANLGGDVEVRSCGRTRSLGAGDAFLDDHSRFRDLRHHTSLNLVVEWDPDHWGTRSVTELQSIHLSRGALLRLRSIARAILRAPRFADEIALLVESASAVLQSEGLPLDPAGIAELPSHPQPKAAELSRALDDSLASLDRASVQDLQSRLGWPTRSIHRRLVDLRRSYGFQTHGWRETLQWWRLISGVILMSAPGTKAEEVASLIGYNSPSAFCHAMSRAGLPSPASVREILRP